MNVIISNKYETMLSTLNIEVIKSISGVFEVSELASQFQNFFYNKMIIDITAIKNYEDINIIQQLSLSLDGSKIILLLDDSLKVNSQLYLSQLVSMGIYNFTKNINSIPFLIENPNQYKDVASYQVLDVSARELVDLKKSMTTSDNVIGQRIIGVKNLTDHAGATTFCYLLKKHLDTYYDTKLIEIDKNDLEYFEEDNLQSVSQNDIEEYLDQNGNSEVIIIDLNDADIEEVCSDILYLIEPGIIPLNKMITRDSNALANISDKKIILNKCVLDQREVEDFEREAHLRTFAFVPYVNDNNTDIEEFIDLLVGLGFTRFDNGSEPAKKGFSLFG